MLIYAIIFINLALVFYTIGVWGEKIQGELKLWHLILFYIGLACDTTGTLFMEALANTSEQTITNIYFHGATGIIAIILMLIHALWATVVLAKRNDAWVKKFHKFSIIVWILWLIPFFSGTLPHMF